MVDIEQVAAQEQEAARAKGDLPVKQSMLSKLEDELDAPPDPKIIADLGELSITELEAKLSRTQGANVRRQALGDGGEKLAETHRCITLELERRKELKLQSDSKRWKNSVSRSAACSNTN